MNSPPMVLRMDCTDQLLLLFLALCLSHMLIKLPAQLLIHPLLNLPLAIDAVTGLVRLALMRSAELLTFLRSLTFKLGRPGRCISLTGIRIVLGTFLGILEVLITAMAAEPSAKEPTFFSHFFDLPFEIRQQIIHHLLAPVPQELSNSCKEMHFRHCLDSDTFIHPSQQHIPKSCQLDTSFLSYLLVSQAFHHDVANTLFQQINYETRCYAGRSPLVKKFVFGPKIRHLHLQIPMIRPTISALHAAATLKMIKLGALQQLDIYLRPGSEALGVRIRPRPWRRAAAEVRLEAEERRWLQHSKLEFSGRAAYENPFLGRENLRDLELPAFHSTREDNDKRRRKSEIYEVLCWDEDGMQRLLRLLAHPKLRTARLRIEAEVHPTIWCPYHAQPRKTEGDDRGVPYSSGERTESEEDVMSGSSDSEENDPAFDDFLDPAYPWDAEEDAPEPELDSEMAASAHERTQEHCGGATRYYGLQRLVKDSGKKGYLEIDVAAVLRDHYYGLECEQLEEDSVGY